MKSTKYISGPGKHNPESGQTNILVLLALGIFFLGFLGFAVDYSNLWFHRQIAQTAADAACQAGAMDLLFNATNDTSLGGLPSPPATFLCSANPTADVCRYLNLNGYTPGALSTGTPGMDATVSFPSSVSGVTTPPSDAAPTPFLHVGLTDRAQVYFSALLTGSRTQDVTAGATCGLVEVQEPIPIIVLNPSCTHPFQVSGSATLTIVGGPTRSVQVNSTDACAAATIASAGNCQGNGTIDLSQGGPDFSGSSFGTTGGPSTPPTNFTGSAWVPQTSPMPDPFRNVPAPSTPAAAPAPTPVGFHIDGCPDNKGCVEYKPGLYTQPIVIPNANGSTAIFIPGIYYIRPTSYPGAASGGNLCGNAGSGCTAGGNGQCRADIFINSGGVVRLSDTSLPSSTGNDGSHGVMFYVSGTSANGYGSIVFDANAGKVSNTAAPGACPATGNRCVESVPATALSCDGSAPNSNLRMPAFVDGNVLTAQCTTNGTYIGGGSTDSINLTSSGVRGLLIFQDHANGDQQGQANLQGGGGLAVSGSIYTHNCTHSPCATPGDYNAFIDLQGTPGTGTFLVGDIITDQLVEAGNGSISMQLNSQSFTRVLKAELLQ